MTQSQVRFLWPVIDFGGKESRLRGCNFEPIAGWIPATLARCVIFPFSLTWNPSSRVEGRHPEIFLYARQGLDLRSPASADIPLDPGSALPGGHGKVLSV